MSNNQKVKVEFDKVIGISAAATLLDIDGQTYWCLHRHGYLRGESLCNQVQVGL